MMLKRKFCRRVLKYVLLLVSFSFILRLNITTIFRDVTSSITSYNNSTRQYRLGTVMVDVTKFGRTFGLQEENHSVQNLLKSKVLHKMSECFQNTVCGEGKDTGPCLRNDSGVRHKFECRHLMGQGTRNMGRTGNQMFQVAALLAIASYHGYTALVDSSDSIASWFELPNLSRVKFSKYMRFGEKSCCRFDSRVKNLSHDTNWTLGGYFQSWRYFEGFEDIIKKAFTIKRPITEEVKAYINSSVLSTTKTVCIHVRRGDYIGGSGRGYSMAPIAYIQNAVRYFRTKYKAVHFFVVSDDKEWCKLQLKWLNVTVSPFLSVGHDMALMVESDHVVVTSGSFGWWGAWLSGGEVVYWTGFPGNGTWLYRQTNFDDYYPHHWVGLS